MLSVGTMAGFSWLGMGFMGLSMLVPVALVVGAVWLAATGLTGRSRRRSDDEADALLRRRLAAGEIDADQYSQARTALGLTRRLDDRGSQNRLLVCGGSAPNPIR